MKGIVGNINDWKQGIRHVRTAKSNPTKSIKKKNRRLKVEKNNFDPKNKNYSNIPVYQELVKNAKRMRDNPTYHEALLKNELEANNIHFKFQKPFFGDGGCYIVDFYIQTSNGVGLVVEVDGDTHNSFDAQNKDAIRSNWLRRVKKCKVVRFTNHQVKSDLYHVIKIIKRIID